MLKAVILGLVLVLVAMAVLMAGGTGLLASREAGERAEVLESTLGLLQEVGGAGAGDGVSGWVLLGKGALMVLALCALLLVLRALKARLVRTVNREEEEPE